MIILSKFAILHYIDKVHWIGRIHLIYQVYYMNKI